MKPPEITPSPEASGVAPVAVGDASTVAEVRTDTGEALASVATLDLPAERYSPGASLGVGGMGEVRLYRDHAIGRDVAVKTLREGASPEAARRFVREARIQGRIEHPSVVPVHDLGLGADGQSYFTMRAVRGRTLAAILRDQRAGEPESRTRFSRRRLLGAFTNVCMAVHYAHTRGVIHRDLKPANVMLGDFNEVYVLDWGIARATALAPEAPLEAGEAGLDDDAADDELTAAGTVLGTRGYMAPEQVRGEVDRLDARTDVYALGVMLYEVLALRRLFAGVPTSEISRLTLAGVEVRPSRAAPDVAPELDAICLRATATDPAERFATAQDLAEAVERYLDGDRDLARRRALAAEHAGRAELTAALALDARTPESEAHAARVSALREVMRALSLDPEHDGARVTLARLLVAVPERMPAAVSAAMAAKVREAKVSGVGVVRWTFAVWLLAIPAMPLVGVREWAPLLAAIGLNLAALAVATWAFRARRAEAWVGALLGAAAFGTIGLCSTWLGPFVYVPAAAAITTLIVANSADPRERPLYVAMGTLSAALPFALEVLRVIPRRYRFEAGNLVLLPRAVGLPEALTMWGLFLGILGYCVLPAVFMGRQRDALSRAERTLFLHAWHLEQLTAAAAPAASADPAARTT